MMSQAWRFKQQSPPPPEQPSIPGHVTITLKNVLHNNIYPVQFVASKKQVAVINLKCAEIKHLQFCSCVHFILKNKVQ